MDLAPARLATFGDEVRARVLGAFYLFGGVVGALTLAVGSWPGADVARLAVITTLTGLTGAAMLLRPGWVPRWACHIAVGTGSIVIALCIEAGGGGGASASYQLYLVWSALYVHIFYGPVVRAAHTAFSGLCLLVALVAVGEGDSAAASLVITLGTMVGGGLIVGHLVGQVRALAGTDPLTGAPNRRTAEQVLGDGLARARRSAEPLSIVLLDLDGFKQLNDASGHATGDQILRDAVRSWTALLRTGTLARLGGDEFLVVLESCAEDDAVAVAQRLVRATPTPVGCSAGVAGWDGVEVDADLLRRCDAALYRGKAEGGGEVVLAARAPEPASSAATSRCGATSR